LVAAVLLARGTFWGAGTSTTSSSSSSFSSSGAFVLRFFERVLPVFFSTIEHLRFTLAQYLQRAPCGWDSRRLQLRL
jgi:hypothetical protein